MTRPRITACVIARDEESRLPACLASLGFCDEVIVVDSGSTDRTRELAAQAGARVLENPWPGFAAQRNFALDHAGGDWVLEIDADERIGPALAASIAAFVEGDPVEDMAALPMREIFLGGRLREACRYPRYRHRLFRRGAYRHDEARTVHEGLWPHGPVAPLAGDMEHLLATTWSEAVADAIAYARLESAQRDRPNVREAASGIVLRPLAKLGYRLGIYGAWRDGGRGIARVALECAADAAASAFSLRSNSIAATPSTSDPPRIGPPRIVGLALGRRDLARTGQWLAAAAEAGADVALVGPEETSGPFRSRRLDGRGPGAVARALDAEDQLRPVDALLLAGRRERAMIRFAPAAVRGVVAPLGLDSDPSAEVAALQTAARSDVGGGPRVSLPEGVSTSGTDASALKRRAEEPDSPS